MPEARLHREYCIAFAMVQMVEPLRQYEPQSLEEIIKIVREAEKHQCQVRAIGSGHSFSDVCLTTGFMVMPRGLTKVIPLDTSMLNVSDHIDPSMLVHVESGITIRALPEVLDAKGLAFRNLKSPCFRRYQARKNPIRIGRKWGMKTIL